LPPEKERECHVVQNTPNEQLAYEIIPKQASVNIPQHDFLFKLIVVGDSAIGKSCLMHRVCNNEF
jgi:GTPase SAR1 family protein